jgi:hypothetical protein
MNSIFFIHVDKKSHLNVPLYFFCVIILTITHNISFCGNKIGNNTLIANNTIIIDPDFFPDVIEKRIYLDDIIAMTRGKGLYEFIIISEYCNKADKIRNIISLSKEQKDEMDVYINTQLADSHYIEILNKFLKFSHIMDTIKDKEKFILLPVEEKNDIENLLLELYQSKRLLRADALNSVLHSSQMRTIREFLLASPSTMILLIFCDNVTEIEIDFENAEFEEIEIINFDCYEALDPSDKQRDQIKMIQENFEKEFLGLLQNIFGITENNKQSEAIKLRSSIDITREITDLVQRTKGLILGILTNGQKARLDFIQRMFERGCLCP